MSMFPYTDPPARAVSRPNTPERIALEELVEAAEAHLAGSHSDVVRARLVLALNAARNVLKAR